MATLHNITCDTCNKKVRVFAVSSNHFIVPTTCNKCKNEKSNKKKEEYLAELAKLTIEERIAKIEAILYNKPWGKFNIYEKY